MAFAKSNRYFAKKGDRAVPIDISIITPNATVLGYNGKGLFWHSPVGFTYAGVQWVYRVVISDGRYVVVSADQGFLTMSGEVKKLTNFSPLQSVLTVNGFKPVDSIKRLSLQRTWRFNSGPNVVNGLIVE